MPEPHFNEAIELAILQVKISNKQAETYTWLTVCFSLAIGFFALAVALATGSMLVFGSRDYTFAVCSLFPQ